MKLRYSQETLSRLTVIPGYFRPRHPFYLSPISARQCTLKCSITCKTCICVPTTKVSMFAGSYDYLSPVVISSAHYK